MSRGLTSRARKAHLQAIKQHVLEVETMKAGCPVMKFGEADRHVHKPHDNPLVVEMKIVNYHVKRVLVDSGSSANIITLDFLHKLKYIKKDVTPTSQPLIGFGEDLYTPSGFAKLAVRLGEIGKGKALPVDFLVVDTPLSYNAIMGRPTMNKIKVSISVYLLLM